MAYVVARDTMWTWIVLSCFYNGCNYLSMMWLKVILVNKRGPWYLYSVVLDVPLNSLICLPLFEEWWSCIFHLYSVCFKCLDNVEQTCDLHNILPGCISPHCIFWIMIACCVLVCEYLWINHSGQAASKAQPLQWIHIYSMNLSCHLITVNMDIFSTESFVLVMMFITVIDTISAGMFTKHIVNENELCRIYCQWKQTTVMCTNM